MRIPRLPLALATLVGFTVVAAEIGVPPEEALSSLVKGNERFVDGQGTHPRQSPERRRDIAPAQHPAAIVLTCADSRLAPEIVFDQGLGDLFVIRNAGNIIDDHVLGSMEYAVEHLHARLIVVLGHSGCGAAKATLEGRHAPGHIHSVVEAIQPALEVAGTRPGDKLDNLVKANAERVATQIKRIEPILNKAVAEGEIQVVAAKYDLETGKVEILK